MQPHKLAQALGWFSLGLGAVELLAPGALARFLGVSGRRGLLRVHGLRELASGAGLLSRRRQAPWLWARVAGDALDLATLARALDRSLRRRNVALATAAVAGVTALDVMCARAL